jgi:hypothetical protein
MEWVFVEKVIMGVLRRVVGDLRGGGVEECVEKGDLSLIEVV